MKSERAHELLGAAIIILIAVAFMYFGRNLRYGEAASMGPGYLPKILSAILFLLGIAIGIRAFLCPPKPVDWPNWRATGVIVVCPIIFGVLVPIVGLAIAVMVVSLLSKLAQRQRWGMEAVVTPVILAIFCSLIFVYFLKLPIKVWP